MKYKIPLHELDGCINTASGRKLNLLDPRPEQISIHDISRGLAYNSHFGGQTPRFFSIAQHCILVCELMPTSLKNNPELMMLALLHDASEAYLGYMVKPLKVRLSKFQLIENHMMGVILRKYRLNQELLPKVKEYDLKAQEFEYNAFYKNQHIEYYPPEKARAEFMRHYYFYLNQRQLIEVEQENSGD